MHRGLVRAFAALALLLGAVAQARAAPSDAPHLERRGTATQLMVDGKPFLVLGGELHNSSSSSLAYMKPVWPRLAAMHLNTVLAPVAWETIEPAEGKFDFSVVDGLIQGARENHLRLAILWFGSWKNTYSSYVPAWVKQDQRRFTRVQMADGQGTERLSPFCAACRDADAKAFARLMQHLREIDGDRHTVLFIQVENEVGVIPQSRDRSPAANAAFDGAVPPGVMRYLMAHRASLDPALRAAWEGAGGKASGTWRQVFGDAALTDDLFMASAYAAYIERVAAAGKAAYALPMYTNAALIRPNYQPGQYNSGGPLPHSIDLWKAGAPSLDFLSPDIYFNEFASWAGAYARPDNPLFVPETAGGPVGAANALYAFGQLKAIGFSPFGIDGGPGDETLAAAYGTLDRLAPLILQAQSEGRIASAVIESDQQRGGARVRIGDYTANIVRTGAAPLASRTSALFLQTGPNEFLVLDAGDAQVAFTSDTPGPPIVGVESIDEQFVQPGGGFVTGRRLNGDEDGQGQVLRLNAADLAQGKVYRVRLYRYR
jgi:hypothetical protein